MLSRIPSDLFRFYSGQGLKVALYAYLRWRLCPFEQIEKYIPKEGRVIDIGCGYGLLANFLTLKSNRRDVTGIDLSGKRISVAQKTTDNRNKIRFKLVNVLDLQLGKYCAMVMSDFLHHIDYKAQEELLVRCYQKIPPEGLLIIEEVDNRPLCKYWFNTIVDRMLNIGEGIFFRNQREFRELLERIGFKVSIMKAHKGIPLSDILYICRK
jgi:2-polyprenyl-6-hydroxyphenyl methylase/3-demethylubiquinone-9 3-methyltransferase